MENIQYGVEYKVNDVPVVSVDAESGDVFVDNTLRIRYKKSDYASMVAKENDTKAQQIEALQSSIDNSNSSLDALGIQAIQPEPAQPLSSEPIKP